MGSPRMVAERFAGCVALVAGGTQGIGRGVATRLHAEGASVVVAGREVEPGREVAGALDAARPGSALFVAADVAQIASVRALIAGTLERFGRLDVAVVNAGMVKAEPFLTDDETTWEATLATNLSGAYYCVREAARVMKPGSSIVVTASTNSFWMERDLAVYNISKAGVAGLVRTAALDLAPLGIRVNAVAPGLIRTRMTTAITDNSGNATPYLATIPLGRFGEPADIAAAVSFLASGDADFVTGAFLLVDGGQTLGSNVAGGGGL